MVYEEVAEHVISGKLNLFCHMSRVHRCRHDHLHIGDLGRCRKELRGFKIPFDVRRYLPRLPAYHNRQQVHAGPQ